jgi:hypothetical protein
MKVGHQLVEWEILRAFLAACLAVSAFKDDQVHQLDVETAVLNGDIEE